MAVANGHGAAETRVAALHALEAIGDARTFDTAVSALGDGDATVAIAAAGVLQALLQSPRGVDALDRLTSVALDAERPRLVRLAATLSVGIVSSGSLVTNSLTPTIARRCCSISHC